MLHELLEKEIVVAVRVVRRIDVETSVSVGRNNQKVDDLMLTAQVFDQTPSTGAEERLLVLTKAMKKVKHRIVPLLRVIGVIVSGQLHTVMNGLLKNLAVDGVAVGPALRHRPRVIER